ncbi:ABC transporter [Ureibacillus massiliensis 4400831 = CIP 108448 = CCUG 49529]|uniref:ABC transporter n=2 Tax=cellular organisms TaxID=131567 RepID=A0A0A3J3Q5_9BACL|nr:ABC transporter permease subunit [Ureibacillus massiliensis]KGR91581.1 ABC transporter [Ureibacillus massiliensis 4400831 = CIP 108448 = CCUG 49529]
MQYVKNEWIKIWAQKNAWIMFGIVLLGVAALLGANKYFEIDQSTPELRQKANNEWLAHYKGLLDSPGMVEEDIQYFNEEILMTEYRIAHDLPAVDATMFQDVVNQLLNFILMLVGIFTMVIAASIVSNEFGTGTIKMLLTRPAARWKILLSKLVASCLYGAAIFVSSIAVGILVSFFLFNTDPVALLSVVDGQVVAQTLETNYAQTILLTSVSMFMTILFAFMLGTLFSSSTLAVSLSLILLFMGTTITVFLAKYDFAKFIWFANDLTQFLPGTAPIIPDLSLNFAIVVNIVYAIIFLAVSFTYFTRRDVTA